jgi:hypothetical protein
MEMNFDALHPLPCVSCSAWWNLGDIDKESIGFISAASACGLFAALHVLFAWSVDRGGLCCKTWLILSREWMQVWKRNAEGVQKKRRPIKESSQHKSFLQAHTYRTVCLHVSLYDVIGLTISNHQLDVSYARRTRTQATSVPIYIIKKTNGRKRLG